MNDSTSTNENSIASSDTLHGQLQRGRGAGFLWALKEDSQLVHPLLAECITIDPRIDHQVEDRAKYYAELVVATQMSLQPLSEHLRNENIIDDNVWLTALTVQTLGSLAQRGYTGAVDILRGYIDYGYLWNYAVDCLAEVPDDRAVEGLDSIICDRFATGKELDDAERYGEIYGTEVWQKWRTTNPCIERLSGEVADLRKHWASAANHQYHHINPAEISLKELLENVDAQNFRKAEKVIASKVRKSDRETLLRGLSLANPFQWALAFRGLSQLKLQHLAYEAVFNNMKAFFESGVERKGPVLRVAYSTMSSLPVDMVLPLAREWFYAPEWYLNVIGAHLMEEHATHEDILGLRKTLIEAQEQREDYRACNVLDILTKFQDIGLLPEVEYAFVQAEYSYMRSRAARAMKANAPDYFAKTFAYECLWDCEVETRLVGCEGSLRDTPGVPERLATISEDEFEADVVRKTAKLKLFQ